MIDERIEWKRWIVLPFLLAIWCGAGVSEAGKELTIDRIASLPALTGTPPSRPAWSRAGDRVAFLWNDRGGPFTDVWTVSAAGGDPVRLTHLDRGPAEPEPTASETDPLAALTRSFRERSRGGVSEVVWTPSGDALVFSFDGHLHRVSARGGAPEILTRSKASRSSLAYSPDGRFLSWVQDGDLWLWRDDEAEPVRATSLGHPAIGFIPGARYNRPDRGIASYRWSPDGGYVALEVEDLRKVRKEAIPDYLGSETEIRHLRRDYPGDHDHVRGVEIYAVATGRLAPVRLDDPTYRLINAYGWAPAAPPRLLIDQVSGDAIDRWFWLVSASNLEVERLWHDARETRNSARLTTSLWRSDGGAILFTADLDGRHRLHSLSITGRAVTTLTPSEWSVASPAFGGPWVEVAPGTKEVFFVATEKSPYERQVYLMPETGGTVTRVTSLPGVHEPTLSPDGKRLALLHSSDLSPRELYLHDGASERRVTRSPPEEFGEYPWVEPRYVTFPSQVDEATIHGRLLEPPDLDRTRKYPAILGPVYSNTVRNQWSSSRETFQQYLAQRGYLVLQVDIRGSSGYGRKFREDLFLDYGGIDVEDLASGAAYLKSLPYVDPDRVGIWGWSYGGLLTSMSLFKKPGVYRAGVAGAPATNVWHALTGQTENIRYPSTHPEVYRKSSSSSYGEDLQDHLMIIHGLQDDVVLFKDSVTLAEKLMMLGKNFDFVILPSATHSFGLKDYVARFVYTKVAEHFDRYLGNGPRPLRSETSHDR